MGTRRRAPWGQGGAHHGDKEEHTMGTRRRAPWGQGGAHHGDKEGCTMGTSICDMAGVIPGSDIHKITPFAKLKQ